MSRTAVLRLACACLAVLSVAGCDMLRPAAKERAVPFDAQGVVALDGVRYAYAFDPAAAPMAPVMMEGTTSGTLEERLMPDGDGAPQPVLRIGFADGQAMTQAHRGGSRRVAAFLCAERADWPRAAGAASPDWLAEGAWHIVAPCSA